MHSTTFFYVHRVNIKSNRNKSKPTKYDMLVHLLWDVLIREKVESNLSWLLFKLIKFITFALRILSSYRCSDVAFAILFFLRVQSYQLLHSRFLSFASNCPKFLVPSTPLPRSFLLDALWIHFLNREMEMYIYFLFTSSSSDIVYFLCLFFVIKRWTEIALTDLSISKSSITRAHNRNFINRINRLIARFSFYESAYVSKSIWFTTSFSMTNSMEFYSLTFRPFLVIKDIGRPS